MKPILEWLETKISRNSAAVEADKRHTPVARQEPKEKPPVPNEDVDQETVTGPGLRTQDDAEPEHSREKGFDPYNTGPLDISKAKNSSSDE